MLRIILCKETYCYIYFNSESKNAVIIDPAWDSKKIEKNIKDLNLKAILLTHHHIDHVSEAGRIAKKNKIPVYMNKIEKDFYHFKCKNLKLLTSEKPFNIEDITIKPYFTPGHTKGSICYSIKGNLFTGDTLFIEGCGLCNIKGGSTYDMYNSFQLLKKEIPLETSIYPGHRYHSHPGVPFSKVVKYNIYFGFSDSESFSNFRNRKIKRIFYPKLPQIFNYIK